MTITFTKDPSVLIELRVAGESLKEITNHSLRMWSESELYALLQRRLGKTELEIDQLLKSVANH